MTDLSACKAVVTAGAAGIGREIASVLLARGARVHVGDVDQQALTALRASLPVGTSCCDVGRPEDVDRLFDEAASYLGGLTVLINNAGIAGPTALPDAISIEDWDRVIRTNVSGMFYCVRRAVPLLRQSGGGTIVNISSAAIRRGGFPHRLPYAVSKTAILGLTQTLAMDLGPDNIRVHTVMPGSVLGARMDSILATMAKASGESPEKIYEKVVASTSMRTAVTANDVAQMIGFLCSDAARHMSGQEISVCANFEGHHGAPWS
jgi:NAD(P)-dependent dehydrogenase (short-subunit alcohol dehydrogenase family)